MSSHEWSAVDDWNGDGNCIWVCSRCGSSIWSRGRPSPDAVVIVVFERASTDYKRGTCDDAIVARVMGQ